METGLKLNECLDIPYTFLGSAGSYDHIECFSSWHYWCCSWSLFVFKGKYRAVLISYPTRDQKLAFPQFCTSFSCLV